MQGSRGQSGPERSMDQGWKCHPISTIIIILMMIIIIISIIMIINIIIILCSYYYIVVITTKEVLYLLRFSLHHQGHPTWNKAGRGGAYAFILSF